MDKIRLLLVDDHPVVRAGLRTLLTAQADLDVVGEAADGAAAIEAAVQLRPDVVVMDITMAGMGGVEATRAIRQRLPDTKVLVLSMHDSEEYLRQVLDAGATGYVLKKATNTELAIAIRAVHGGEVLLNPTFTRILLGGQPADRPAEGQPASGPDEHGREPLSEREVQVLRLIAEGYTNRQVAERLYLSVRTIETYRVRLMEKLQITSRVGLVRYALRNRLLDGVGGENPDDPLPE